MNRAEQTERDYRAALDSLRFSGEAKERMVERLARERDTQPVKGRRMRPLRAGVLAACLCMMLAGTAVAVAEISGVQVRWLNAVWDPSDGETLSGYAIINEDLALFPLECFSEEAIALSQEEEIHSKPFSNWEDLEQFLGLDIFNNPVLDAAGPGYQILEGGVKDRGTHMRLFAFSSGFFARSSQRLEGIIINLDTMMYTELFDQQEDQDVYVSEEYKDKYEAYKGATAIYETQDGAELTELEIYTARCGIPVTIMQYTDDRGTWYRSHFLLNGIQVNLSAETDIRGYKPESRPNDPAHTLEVLKNVLDGFEL